MRCLRKVATFEYQLLAMSGHGKLQLRSADGVKVYSVSGGRALPDFANEKKERRKLNKDDNYR